jgi:hypothetical protein
VSVFSDPTWPQPEDTGPPIDPKIGLRIAAGTNALQADRLHRQPTAFLSERVESEDAQKGVVA